MSLFITLLRHAKSARDDALVDDFDRPLTRRGRRDAKRVAKRIVRGLPAIDQALASPAARTRRTLRAVRRATGLRRRQVRFDHALYGAPRARIAQRIRKLGHGHHLLLVGHNPGLSELAAWLTGKSRVELPTATALHLVCDIADWSGLRAGCARQVAVERPRGNGVARRAS